MATENICEFSKIRKLINLRKKSQKSEKLSPFSYVFSPK